ncbi:MAG: hypothetical protein WA688_06145 [Thermoplasmata archaeon]
MPERVFAIGGCLAVAAGGLLLVAFVLNPVPLLWGLIEAAVLLVGFGGFFVYVGSGARRARQRLLDSPKPPQ